MKSMMARLSHIFCSGAVVSLGILLNSCDKGVFEPEINGRWMQINNTTDKQPTGCEFYVDRSTGTVEMCGIGFVQPNNAVAVFSRGKAKLFTKNGQMYYRERNSSLFYIAPIVKEDQYFIDYDFDGEFLWIIGDKSSSKTTAKGVGKVFIRKQ